MPAIFRISMLRVMVEAVVAPASTKEIDMDIPFLILAVACGLLLSRNRALLVTGALWVVAVTMVAWGPAHSDGVHTNHPGFWGAWVLCLAVGLGLSAGAHYLRHRRRDASVAG